MTGPRRPFGPEELPADEGPAALADSLAMGRELEAAMAHPVQTPDEEFTDRVMAAIALEPVPQPATVAGRAVRGGSVSGVVAALRDAWRVAFSGGRPLAVRAQALALVLVAALAVGSVLSAGAVGVAGALGLFNAPAVPVQPSPTPSPSPSPDATPSPSPSVAPSPSPSPSVEPTATPPSSETPYVETPSPTGTDDDLETREPDHTEDPTDDHGGLGSGSADSSDDSSGSGSGSDG
jgi:hypothetical protein